MIYYRKTLFGIGPKLTAVHNRSALLMAQFKHNKRLQLFIGIGVLLLILVPLVVNLLRS